MRTLTRPIWHGCRKASCFKLSCETVNRQTIDAIFLMEGSKLVHLKSEWGSTARPLVLEQKGIVTRSSKLRRAGAPMLAE